jgi:hypothetical protein
MSANLDYLYEAGKLLTGMIQLVKLFELEAVSGGVDDFEFDLTQDQINAIIAAFVQKRTALKAAVDSVTAS